MVNGFNRLGHDTVIGRHHQDDHVGHLGPPGPHGGEGFVSRCIQESDVLPGGKLHLVGTNVLGDTSRFAAHHIGFADIIQERCFSVVHMTHDRYHRGARLRISQIFFRFIQRKEVFAHVFQLFSLIIVFFRQQFNNIPVQALVYGGQHPQTNALLNNFTGFDTKQFCQFIYAGEFGDFNGLGGTFRLFLLFGLVLFINFFLRFHVQAGCNLAHRFLGRLLGRHIHFLRFFAAATGSLPNLGFDGD